ncbi:5-(carboxyamino)imidazole ribonucleotide synthase [Paracoccus tegillarcae]|uniref:N5-carboxyaminoimidazole ribonucleotide synthase n=1 Tax=Paracoccus tegillarcae TaxID=1529068 RepID=A0A2K9EKJ5_9RHOB|nr:5-(carboxyamino)imidazole ribonucleotide synthase [Paracoccus tegillarcae]AUH35570.1 5-(carboxyamino)imidazole ribonucleotide synthase [Paracoccus tegillarcae]
MSDVCTIGILGGGQLGRMLSVAASRLGLRCHIYEPGAAPAGDVAYTLTNATYTDDAALTDFAGSVDVVTYEFENVPTEALDLIESIVPIRPNRHALAVSQDRLTEKTFLNEIGLTTAPFADVPERDALAGALAQIGTPSILKTRRMGYDGKGQVRITDAGDAEWTGAPSVLEGFVEFSGEISVIVARGADGQVAAYDPGLNVHGEGILRTTTVPCGLPAMLTSDAVLIAARIANALDYVGVMGVELFVTPQGLIVNEIAPRVHNSGHWTQAGCAVDQFEQHIRAVAGLPLGDGGRYADVVMENLIGDDMKRVPDLMRAADTQVHLYGKGEARAGRKMGHVNRVTR